MRIVSPQVQRALLLVDELNLHIAQCFAAIEAFLERARRQNLSNRLACTQVFTRDQAIEVLVPLAQRGLLACASLLFKKMHGCGAGIASETAGTIDTEVRLRIEPRRGRWLRRIRIDGLAVICGIVERVDDAVACVQQAGFPLRIEHVYAPVSAEL